MSTPSHHRKKTIKQIPIYMCQTARNKKTKANDVESGTPPFHCCGGISVILYMWLMENNLAKFSAIQKSAFMIWSWRAGEMTQWVKLCKLSNWVWSLGFKLTRGVLHTVTMAPVCTHSHTSCTRRDPIINKIKTLCQWFDPKCNLAKARIHIYPKTSVKATFHVKWL